MTRDLHLRSSAAEYLIFSAQSEADAIEVRYEDGTLWLTQKMLGLLFGVEKSTLTYHLANIYQNSELTEAATVRIFRTVQIEGTREVTRDLVHYNLDAVITKRHALRSNPKDRA